LVTYIFSFLKGRVYQEVEKFSCLLLLKQTMAGGLMQLVAYGAQDVYLTGSPKVTFFQAVYKRHTNFAMENIEQVVNGSAGPNARLSVTVARNGDLIGEMYLEMTNAAALHSTTDLSAPASSAAASMEWVAERAISDVELTVGGQRIDKHYQKWWRLYSELYLDDAKKAPVRQDGIRHIRRRQGVPAAAVLLQPQPRALPPSHRAPVP
jgi:hypothetical protein